CAARGDSRKWRRDRAGRAERPRGARHRRSRIGSGGRPQPPRGARRGTVGRRARRRALSRRRPRVNLQFVADGVLTGAMIGLGAIGVTLTYSILRFSNFAHGEFIAWGAYLALAVSGAIGWLTGAPAEPIGPLSFGWRLIFASLAAMVLTGLLALALDFLLFRRLREK